MQDEKVAINRATMTKFVLKCRVNSYAVKD